MNKRSAPRRSSCVLHFLVLVGVVGCGASTDRRAPPSHSDTGASTAAGTTESKKRSAGDFRRNQQAHALTTQLAGARDEHIPPKPPTELFGTVHYPAPLGSNVAYVSPVRNGPKRPAVIWIAGGFTWDIGEGAWAPAPRSNDQSARAFREAGLVLMLPALRGASGNPGRNECFLGEVDDILAAGEFLSQRADVDPARIYLGGHSTGGTMVLLAAASTDMFRAVFSFGPVADPTGYGSKECNLRSLSPEERNVRAPVSFIADINTPTFVIEGGSGGNVGSFVALRDNAHQAPVRFFAVPGTDHFSVLAPASDVIALKILGDTGPTSSISLTRDELMGR